MQLALKPTRTLEERQRRATSDPRTLPPEDLLAVILGSSPTIARNLLLQNQARSLVDLLNPAGPLRLGDLPRSAKARLLAALELALRIVAARVGQVDLGLEHSRSVQRFVKLHCHVSDEAITRLGSLTAAYRHWSRQLGAEPASSRALEDVLRRLGAEEHPGGNWGVRLTTNK